MAESDSDTRRLGDSFAVALLHWPAVVGCLAAPPEGWWLVLKVALGAWVVLLALTMILGRGARGARWGLAMTLCAALVAGFWITHPGGWMYVFLAALPIGFHAALRARLDEPAKDGGGEARRT